MRRAAAVLLVLLAGAGCTLISGVGDLEAVEPSDSGTLMHEAGGDGSSAHDGSIAADGAGVDASRSDAGSDAADADASVRAQTFCEARPAGINVCFDYDSVSYPAAPPPTQTWSTIKAEGPGHDSTSSLHCVGVDNQLVQCFHTVVLPANTPRLRYTFDLQIEQVGGGIEVSELQFLYSNATKCALQPYVVGGKVYVNEYCPGVSQPEQINHEIATLATLGAPGAALPWYTFDISIDLETRSLSGTFKSSSSKSAALAFGPISLNEKFVTSTSVELHAGLSFATPNTPAAKVRLDNVTVDLP